MRPRTIKQDVYCLGAVDWDRRLFDSLIPLPDGTTYNAYLIKGSEKTVLIDTVDPEMEHILLKQLEGTSNIDYVVSLHAEQDHSGSLPAVLEKYPEAKLITSEKAKSMLMDLLHISEDRITTVKDGETLELGGKTLEFIYTPWVHWPETMVAYLREDKILFSCDFFGSHIASSDIFVTDEARVYEAAKRYFAEIMLPFRGAIIEKNMDKLAKYDIHMIAPSHGQIYDNPKMIIDAYNDWLQPTPKNLVVVPYVSMHNSTKEMVEYFVSALVERGVEVQQFELTGTDIGKLAISLVDAATIVLGTPTVLAGPHPVIANAAFLANALRTKAKFVSIIGSYGWGGRTVDVLAGMIPNIKAEVLDPILCKGKPKADTFEKLAQLADVIAAKHKEL